MPIDTTSRRPIARSRAAARLTTVALSAAGAVLATWPLAREIGRATLRGGEVLLTAWQINWYHHALLTHPLAWVDANIFFPYDNAATFNDLLLTHAIVTLPASWADSPVLSLNLAFLGGIVLCGLFAHLFIDEVTGASWPAVVGGILFALAPFRFLHIGHLSIAAAWPVPLFMWALLAHLRQPSSARAAATAASGLALGLSSLYHAAFVAPIVPLMLLVGARRGPGGRQVWLPLAAWGLLGLAVLAAAVAPYATTLRSFGVASAAGDLQRFGADLSSLTRKPQFLGGAAPAGIDAEAHLYPGAGLVLLAVAGSLLVLIPVLMRRGLSRYLAGGTLLLVGIAGLGSVASRQGAVALLWSWVVLALVWGAPVFLGAWAVATTRPDDARGAGLAIRLGLAGAALSFALALGPDARLGSEIIGPAPYRLLTLASSAFEGTRVPARFGSLVILFLALTAGGALAAGGRVAAGRAAALVLAGIALAACFRELPVPALPGGRALVPLPPLGDPVYEWLGERGARLAVLELPEWSGRGPVEYPYQRWRALRYMLASKQHGQHLVNGWGRIEPFLFHRFRHLEPWSEDSLSFIASYFPVDYVLVHEGGIPVGDRAAVWATLNETGGWTQVFRSSAVRVYRVDRSAGRGPVIDRLMLRRDLVPGARVSFSVRGLSDGSAGGPARPAVTIELLQDGQVVGTWPVDQNWQRLQVAVSVDAVAPDVYDARCSPAQPAPCAGWPRAGVLLRWQIRGRQGQSFEMHELTIEPRDERD